MSKQKGFIDTLFRLLSMVLAFSFVALPAYGQQIHQLLYNNSYWSDQDLNAPSQSYSLAAFPTIPNDQTHVYFLVFQPDGSFHVHQLFYNGASWADEDLTVASGAPEAINGPVTGFSVGNYQYVYYLSTDGGVHQLLYNNSTWVDSNLTVLSKSAAYPGFGALVAFTTSPALHVYYQDDQGLGSGDIHQLYSTDGNSWKDQDLTALTGAPLSFRLESGFNIGNSQYVYYHDALDYDLHQLRYNNIGWSDLDISASSKIPPDSGNCSLETFVIPGTQKMRRYYCSYPTNHLMQLSSNNGTSWASTDLTNKSKGPTPDPFSWILAYATTPNDAIHVFYETGNHIHEIFQPTATTWAHQDITAQGDDFGKVVNNSPLAGFSLGNYQYVFYFAQ